MGLKSGREAPAQNVTIRRGDEGDIPQMLQLWREMMDYHAHVEKRFVPLPPPEGEAIWAEYLRADILGSDDWCVLVAEADGELVGQMIGCMRDPVPVFQADRFGYVTDVIVAPAYRRQGIGRRLVGTMCDWFRRQGAEHVQLQVAHRNPASRSFWREMGFTDYMVSMWHDLDD